MIYCIVLLEGERERDICSVDTSTQREERNTTLIELFYVRRSVTMKRKNRYLCICMYMTGIARVYRYRREREREGETIARTHTQTVIHSKRENEKSRFFDVIRRTENTRRFQREEHLWFRLYRKEN